MPLMIIGRARKPRLFKCKSGTELGFEYHANKKAWFRNALFFSWLARLNRYVQRTKARKIHFLVDNCSAHGMKEELHALTNVCVEYLPPNTTSKVKPLGAGIITWVKTQYKCLMLFHVFENMDVGKAQSTT